MVVPVVVVVMVMVFVVFVGTRVLEDDRGRARYVLEVIRTTTGASFTKIPWKRKKLCNFDRKASKRAFFKVKNVLDYSSSEMFWGHCHPFASEWLRRFLTS